jgi:cation-transporting ATPase 13A2
MENKLKDVTTATIKNLKDCKTRVIMATGDNALTAVSVARNCAILDRDKECMIADVDD